MIGKAILLLIVLALIVSCGDEYYGDTTGSTDTGPFSIESEPSLSPDGNNIYYIARDTALGLYSGIYRVGVAAKDREKIYFGHGYHSPSINFDNNRIAFLKSGYVHYFNLSDLSISAGDSSISFKSIMYITDSIMLACRSDSIYVFTEANQSYPLTAGWDPTFISRDTFVYINEVTTDSYTILKSSSIFAGNPTILYSITTDLVPRWPSYDPASGKLVFSLTSQTQNFIYIYNEGDTGSVFIDESDYSKPLMLSSGKALYTGPDGRFYQADENGNTPFVN